MGAAREFLILDPYHEYGARFIELLFRRYGHRAICVYTDRRERLRKVRHFPILSSECIGASYDVPPQRMADFAVHVAHRHDVIAVVPFSEPTVHGAAELAERLRLPWAQREVMRRYRDKFALKEHLRREHPGIRVNASRLVGTPEEVLEARRLAPYERFVLKPNDGYGNRHVALFTRESPADEVRSWLSRSGGAPLLMEQYVDGPEFFVNGQTSGTGQVDVIAIFEYVRRAANGRCDIDYETLLVPRRDPRFAQLADYAERVVAATALRRSPFHLELKVDGEGPCLIEVGARLAGHGNATLSGELHGPALDLFALAAHYYLDGSDYGPLPLDWNRYDARAVRYVHGIATRGERLHELEGVREVEALPQFREWVCKPAVGMRVERTLDSLSMPYSLILEGETQLELSQAASRTRELLRWNRARRPVERAARETGLLLERFATGLRIRTLSALTPESHAFEPIVRIGSLGALWRRARALCESRLDRLWRGWQCLELGLPRPWRSLPRPVPNGGALATEVSTWAREYIARPHPELGRPGPICPFMQPSLELGRFTVKSHDGASCRNARRLRGIILDEAHRFLEGYPRQAAKNRFAGVALVFPGLAEADFHVLDEVHDQLKTHLITRHDLMSTPFHPRSTRSSISNRDFPVFRSPFPLFAMRHLDVRDIAFVDRNPRAFSRYRERFGTLFERGEVSDEFGYVRRFAEACERYAGASRG